MASCRFGVGQGAIAWFVMGSLLLASACSSDSNVLFDDAPPSSSGGNASSGGSGSGSGAAASGGSGAESGSGQGGQAGGAAGSSTAGTASGAGSDNGGSNTGGVAGKGGSNNGGRSTGGNSGSAGAAGSDECTAASFGQHTYYFCGLVDSAPLAAAKCQSLGMSMLSIESELENAFVLGKQKGSSWLGGTDELSEGHWIWASSGVMFWDEGQAIPNVYENFQPQQPNDNGADGAHENCLVLTADGWNDVLCSLDGFRAACESTP
jgi:hypothetical protein